MLLNDNETLFLCKCKQGKLFVGLCTVTVEIFKLTHTNNVAGVLICFIMNKTVSVAANYKLTFNI